MSGTDRLARKCLQKWCIPDRMQALLVIIVLLALLVLT
jgi:hypothetical protein